MSETPKIVEYILLHSLHVIWHKEKKQKCNDIHMTYGMIYLTLR